MLTKLNHSNEEVANQIYTIFQSSYKVEAQLIGILDFPPLLRGTEDIKNSNTNFYGYFENNSLAGIIEIALDNKHLEIHSLTVEPGYFRNGIADKLVNYIIGNFDYTEAIVETAVVNIPAVNLYKKHGFIEFRRWIAERGIEKLAMSTQ
jgi:ribosomal protein S18 acetylase RimI-like enzyme